MPIEFSCNRGNQLRVNEDWSGWRMNCAACGRSVLVPEALCSSDATSMVQTPAFNITPVTVPGVTLVPAVLSESKSARVNAKSPGHLVRNYGYFAFLLALFPSFFSLFGREEEAGSARLYRTLAKAPFEVRQRTEQIIAGIPQGKASMEELFDALPERRLERAHLPRRTIVHFLYAIVAVAVFSGLVRFLVPGRPVP